MKFSVVATLYQSGLYLAEFYERASAAARQLAGDDYEIVLVNDGSPDDSLARAVELSRKDSHVVVVDLSRNFGHHKAMMTGLSHALGEKVFLIDSDLEESPEWLIEFNAKLEADASLDVVFGFQESRKGNSFERLSGAIFWSLINRLSGLSLKANVVTARLMSRRYVETLLRHEEREVFMAGLWQIAGYNQYAVPVVKLSRPTSTYTFRRKVSLLVDSVTSFSALPLVAIFYAGLMTFAFAFAYALYLLVNWYFFAYAVAGWTSVMLSIWFLGGMILSSVGVVGIYLSKVFSESKRRPYTVVREIYGR